MLVIVLILVIYMGLLSDYMVVNNETVFRFKKMSWIFKFQPEIQRINVLVLWSLINFISFILGYFFDQYLEMIGQQMKSYLGKGILLALGLRIYQEAISKEHLFSVNKVWDISRIGAHSLAMAIQFFIVGFALQSFGFSLEVLVGLFLLIICLTMVMSVFVPFNRSEKQIKYIKKWLAVCVFISSCLLLIINAKT